MIKFNSGKPVYVCECCHRVIKWNPIKCTSRKGRELHYCTERCKSIHYFKQQSDRKRVL